MQLREDVSVLAEERRFRITEFLSRQRSVGASELTALLGVTAATIRRDLAELERKGMLVRSHGGAVSTSSTTSFQPSYAQQGKLNPEEKKKIAAAAARLVVDGETVFLEGSTTVAEMVPHLHSYSRLTVVTNSPLILFQLQRYPAINVIATGGELRHDIFYLSGVWTQRALAEIRVDKAFMGVSALDASYGISTASQAEASIKQAIVRAAKVRVGLADHSKFGKQSFAFVGPLADLQLVVTDGGTAKEVVRAIEEAGVKVIVAADASHEAAHARKTVRSKKTR
jgi:DeoR family fructose operon transcriptional repressor